MINFSKYSLREIQAIVQVLDILTEDMPEDDIGYAVAMSYYHVARKYEEDIMLQHEHAMAMVNRDDHAAAEAEKVNRIKEACVAGAPPAEAPAPDMFGWVGDALDGLEVKLSD